MLGRHSRNWKLTLSLLLALGLFATSCTSDTVAIPAPESSTTTTVADVDRETTLRIGIAVNAAAPTAAFDAEIEMILREAALLLGVQDSEPNTEEPLRLELTSVSIETPGQAEGAIAALVQAGISVVVTGCDDATIPAVVEAATTNELLAVTGCVALPLPDISRSEDGIDPALFIDLASLADNARAIAVHAAAVDYGNLGVIRSNLLPDVDQACVDLQTEVETLTDLDLSVVAETTFTELVDAPTNVVSTFEAALAETGDDGRADAIILCALPPTAGDMVEALRSAGFDQTVIVPWYSDSQSWADDTSNVSVVTPASRYGDDPQSLTTELFDALTVSGDRPDAVDVITADILAILVDAVRRAESVGSSRVAEAIRGNDADVDGVSGMLDTARTGNFPVRREYRVVLIDQGQPAFSAIASSIE